MADRIAGAANNEDVVRPAGLERHLRRHIGRSNIERSLPKEAVNNAWRSEKSLHRLSVQS
jgi:hypothetical protein